MNCVDVQDSLVEYLLGELDLQRRTIVEQHLATGCIECRSELQALAESVDVLWQAVPNKPLSEELQQGILSRVRAGALADEQTQPVTMVSHPASKRSQLVRNPIVQALLAFAAGLLFMMFFQPSKKTEGEQQSSRRSPAQTGSTINWASPRIPASLEMSEKKYESTQLVSLRRKPDFSELRGYVLCDALTREIHIFCFGLQQPMPGTQYVLWLVGPGIEVRAAERLVVDSKGECKAALHWPAGDIHSVKITLEVSSQLNSKPSNDVELTSNPFEPFTY